MRKNHRVHTLAFVLLLLLVLVPVLSATEHANATDTGFLTDAFFNFKVRTYMKIEQTPSLVACVLNTTDVVWMKAYGHSNVYLRKKATLDTIYLTGSISKTVTAMALMQLYDNKMFNLDDNVSKYLPFDLKNPNYPTVNITYRMLLAHQASLGDYRQISDLRYYFPLSTNRTQWIQERLIPGQPLYRPENWMDYPPGANCSYSNMGYIIAALLVERITHTSFEDYCQQHIFTPLQMNHTSFNVGDLNQSQIAPPNFHILGLYIPLFNYDTKCLDACTGLRTTVTDLSHFLLVHMNHGVWNNVRVINASTLDEMHTVQYPNSSHLMYGWVVHHGLGWVHLNISGDPWEGYSGGALGYCCNMMIQQSSNTAVIMLQNGQFKRSSGVTTPQQRIKAFVDLGYLLLQKASC